MSAAAEAGAQEQEQQQGPRPKQPQSPPKPQQEPREKGPAAGGHDVLFPDVVAAGRTITPWTLRKASRLAPVLAELRRIVREENLALEKLSADSLIGLLEKTAHLAPAIIAVSTGMTEEEAGDLFLDEAGQLLGAIISANLGYLKNSWSLDRDRGKPRYKVA